MISEADGVAGFLYSSRIIDARVSHVSCIHAAPETWALRDEGQYVCI